MNSCSSFRFCSNARWPEIVLVLFLLFILIAAVVCIGVVNAIPLFIDLLLVVAFTLFAASLFDLRGAPAFFLAVYLLFLANIVLVGEIGSLLGLLGSRFYFICAHLVLAGFGSFAWHRVGRPPLLAPLESFLRQINRQQIINSLISHPVIWLFALAVMAAYGVGLYVIISEPQNIDDVLTTHLARVGFWLQNGSLRPWPTSTYNLPQVVGPPNAQFPLAWTILFWGGDQLVGLGQWMAVWVCMVAIYALGRLLGASRWQGAAAALIFATFPCIVLQSTQALFDVTVAALFICVVYFLFLGLKSDLRKPFWLSGIALGIAIGTKQTVYFALPGLAIAICLLWLSGDRLRKRSLEKWIQICALGVLFLGVYGYVQNLVFFGHPLGPAEVYNDFSATGSSMSLDERIEMAHDNLVCTGLFATIGELPDTVIETLDIRGCHSNYERLLRDTIKYSAYAWFGPVGFLLFFIAIGYGLWAGLIEKDHFQLGLVIIIICYTIVLALVRKFTAANSRYMILAVLLVMPVAAAALKRGDIFLVAVAISLFMVGYTRIYDGTRPLVGEYAVGTVDRIARLSYDEMSFHETMLRVVDGNVPEDAVLGIILPDKAPQSPLFGEHYTRTVVPFDRPYPPVIDADWLESRNLDYLLIQTIILEEGSKLSGDVEIIPVDELYVLITTHSG
jgi:hypothetical protein